MKIFADESLFTGYIHKKVDLPEKTSKICYKSDRDVDLDLSEISFEVALAQFSLLEDIKNPSRNDHVIRSRCDNAC